MRPKEFISRSLDLLDFSGHSWPEPDSFNSAALAVNLMQTGKTVEVSGYNFVFDSQKCLGHIVMVVEVFEGSVAPSHFRIGASVCFTFQSFDFSSESQETEDHIYETWRLPDKHNESIDKIMEVLTFLTLKTNYRILNKVSG